MTLSAPVTPDATHVARALNVVSVVQTAQGSEARVVQGPTIAWPDADSAFALLDRSAHAEIARLTGGLSPAALVLAFVDWGVHLATSPGKQLSLGSEIMEDVSRLFEIATHFTPAFQPWSLIKPQPNDHRFSDPD
jgi:polyhydroxyalkanoate synthase subunit PhaC